LGWLVNWVSSAFPVIGLISLVIVCLFQLSVRLVRLVSVNWLRLRLRLAVFILGCPSVRHCLASLRSFCPLVIVHSGLAFLHYRSLSNWSFAFVWVGSLGHSIIGPSSFAWSILPPVWSVTGQSVFRPPAFSSVVLNFHWSVRSLVWASSSLSTNYWFNLLLQSIFIGSLSISFSSSIGHWSFSSRFSSFVIRHYHPSSSGHHSSIIQSGWVSSAFVRLSVGFTGFNWPSMVSLQLVSLSLVASLSVIQ